MLTWRGRRAAPAAVDTPAAASMAASFVPVRCSAAMLALGYLRAALGALIGSRGRRPRRGAPPDGTIAVSDSAQFMPRRSDGFRCHPV